jgi:hypothetical protein
MQAEIDDSTTAKPVHILGVNGEGHESGNPVICDGRTIPWLQDTPAADVWASWAVTYRDVVILDADNQVLHVYNLTSQSLYDPANYAALKKLLLDSAGRGVMASSSRPR